MTFTASGTEVSTFEEYAAAAWPSLYRYAYLLAGNHSDAEDLAQQTLIKAHRAWSRVSSSDSPNAYVRRMITNTYLSRSVPRRAGSSCSRMHHPNRQPPLRRWTRSGWPCGRT